MGMNRFNPRFVSSALVTSVWLASWPSLAQETPPTPVEGAPAPAPATPAPASALPPPAAAVPPSEVTTEATAEATQGPIFVTVSIEGYTLEAGSVAAAIARELNVALSTNAQQARTTFEVTAVRDRDLAVTFRDQSGHELKRVVKAPANDAQVSEVAALLAVNLSQDKSAELLAELTPPPKPAVTPEPTQAQAPQPAQTPSQGKPPAPELPFVWGNATFVYPLAVVRDVDKRNVGVEVGLLYSQVGAISYLGVNELMLHVRQSTRGVLLSGFGTIAGDSDYVTPQDTVRIAGFFNYGMGPMRGVGIAGFADFENVPEGTQRGLIGAQLSGFINGVNADAEAMQLAGAINYSKALTGVQVGGLLGAARGPLVGGQVSGLLNYSEEAMGAQISGLANVANGNMQGAQISGLANFINGDVHGAQISGGANIASDVTGAQIGIVNIGKHVKGAQIGLVNIAEKMEGPSIGVVTYSKSGQTQLTAWFDSTRPVNVGARFVSGVMYAMPMVGGDPTKTDEFSFGFSLGARIPVDRLYFDLEGNASNRIKDGKFEENYQDLRYRAAIGVRLTPWLGVFAGGGARHEIFTDDAIDNRVRGLWNAGIDLF